MRESALTATVAAISTPPGKGGVALIRVSGEAALSIAQDVFFPRDSRPLGAHRARTAVYGDILYEGKAIDDAVALYFPAPHSFTGEDTVEITCHGGILITQTVLEALLCAGAQMAGPGEFTRRAFINGKISLSDAEAIGNLLDAKSMAQIRLAGGDARKKYTEQIRTLRGKLIELMSALFARIDYPDEDLGQMRDEDCARVLCEIRDSLGALCATYRTGRAVNEGIRTVICGRPNAGKSTLYNLLCAEDAAIVTDVPGTTRDVLERTCPLGRVLLRLCDTAGVHNTSDPVEKIGVARSRERIRDAQLIFAVFDASEARTTDDDELLRLLADAPGVKIAVKNKSDKPGSDRFGALPDIFDAGLVLSAKHGNTRELEKIVNRLFTDERITPGEDAIVFSARQNASLQLAQEHIAHAIDAFCGGLGTDAGASDIERAIEVLSQEEGTSVSEEVVASIFSTFCVGK